MVKLMSKIKQLFQKIFGESIYVSIVSVKRKIFKNTYLIRENMRMFFKSIKLKHNKKYKESINNTLCAIKKHKDKPYIIFHNPSFMGVTSATKELFDFLVSCGDVYSKKDINRISKLIIDSNIKEVYFSAFCYNWKKIIIKLRELNDSIIIKTYWHGSHSQVLDTFGWNRNLEIMSLHKQGYINQMATCKNSLIKFYKQNDFNAIFLNNTVNFDGDKYRVNVKNKQIKLGIYSANTEWRKNMMCQVGAAKLIDNVIIDMVPLNPEAHKLATSLNIKMDGLKKPIPRDELLKRIAHNDVNLYVTFSECAPMLPLESLEVGVPCIAGNNHHYFKNTPLGEYLIINNETDVIEIKEKIERCIKEKNKILELYKTWKKENDLYTKRQIEKFIGGDSNEQ